MLQRLKNRVPLPLAAGTGLCAILLGVTVLAINDNWQKVVPGSQLSDEQSVNNPKSAVLPLVSLPPAQRILQLSAIAQLPKSLERTRARYLLASDLISQNQGEKALSYLTNLEQDYPVLAAYVVLKRAQAYESQGDANKAQATYLELLQRYPNSPVAAEALFVLGKTEPKYWQSAMPTAVREATIAQFPAHPRTIEIANLLLQQNPNQPQLMLLLVKHAPTQTGSVARNDRLVSEYKAQLQPQDWEAIAQSYWENQEYTKAATAYAKAPKTPLNIYRIGRSLQLTQKYAQAQSAYQQLIKSFPTGKQSSTALANLARMAETPQDALKYLDQIIAQHPNQAGVALVEKAKILNTLGNQKSASQALQLLLTQYKNSDSAAEYRWKIALEKAAAKNYRDAWIWAEPIPTNNPRSILAPRAGFWVGKWAQKLGRQQDAKASFEYVLSQFPQSYYAWRSAAMLGLNVGDFNNVRQLNPEIVMPTRAALTAGSDTLKELYQLGQDADAWTLWQAEFQNSTQPTIAEQFTDGLMHLAAEENLKGINKISTLEDRELPPEQTEYQALRQQLTYWQARYPFPFFQEIETWSKQRQLNPLLVTGLIRQESRFEPKIRSIAGATGLMQLMPDTAKWVAQKIDLQQYDVENPNDNIQMGTWYFDHTHEIYNNNSLLAIASYNAGPGNVSKWLKTIDTKDADEFVEAIPFEETKGYVRQVFGNYWNYLRLYNPEISQLVAQYSAAHPKLAQP